MMKISSSSENFTVTKNETCELKDNVKIDVAETNKIEGKRQSVMLL